MKTMTMKASPPASSAASKKVKGPIFRSWPWNAYWPVRLDSSREAPLAPKDQLDAIQLRAAISHPDLPQHQARLETYRQFYNLPGQSKQALIALAGYDIHVMHWQQTHAKGTVWVLHGYLEHSALYAPLYTQLLEAGYDIITFDLPGHGLSTGEHSAIQDFDEYQQILAGLQAQYGQSPLPWLAIGQSTGAAIIMQQVLTQRVEGRLPLFARAMLLSPLVRPAKSAWWHNTAGLAVISRFKQQVPRYFRRNNSNPEFLRFVRLQDPLQPRTMSLRWIQALSRWMLMMKSMPSCRFPVWLVQGARDQTVDWRFNNEYIRQHFRLQCQLLLEEGSHQLINERADIRAPLTALIPAFLTATD